MIAASLGLRNCLGGTAHFMIADKYKTISEKIPQTLAGETPKDECQFGMKVLFWLNILLPLADGVVVFIFN